MKPDKFKCRWCRERFKYWAPAERHADKCWGGSRIEIILRPANPKDRI